MPASAIRRTPSCTAMMPATDGVPLSMRRIVGATSYVSDIANRSAALHHPAIGWVTAPTWRSATYMNAGAPGPLLRYL